MIHLELMMGDLSTFSILYIIDYKTSYKLNCYLDVSVSMSMK